MKSAKVSEVKARLSAYLARVKAGDEVVITERGTPVAKLVPVPPGVEDEEAHLARLERAGLLTRAKRKLPRGFWDEPIPKDPDGLILKALLEERREGR